MKMNKILVLVVIVLYVGVGSFFVGLNINKNKTDNSRFNNMNMDGLRQDVQGRQGGNLAPRNLERDGFITGEILNKDENSITVKSLDGSSRIVFFSENTKINKNIDVTIEDLILNNQVMINGKTNTDGSISAESIQINPNFQNSRLPQNIQN